jgi:hypothetical protein
MRGLFPAILLSAFDIAAEFVFHGFGFIAISVIVTAFLISSAFALRRIQPE